MRTRGLGFIVVAILLAIAASACGGNDSDESGHGSAAAIDPVQEICTDLREAIDERGDFPVDDFDPENPAPQDLPAVGEYFAALAIAREMSGLRYTRVRIRPSCFRLNASRSAPRRQSSDS